MGDWVWRAWQLLWGGVDWDGLDVSNEKAWDGLDVSNKKAVTIECLLADALRLRDQEQGQEQKGTGWVCQTGPAVFAHQGRVGTGQDWVEGLNWGELSNLCQHGKTDVKPIMIMMMMMMMMMMMIYYGLVSIPELKSMSHNLRLIKFVFSQSCDGWWFLVTAFNRQTYVYHCYIHVTDILSFWLQENRKHWYNGCRR